MTKRQLPQGMPPSRDAKETETATMDAVTLIADLFALVPVPPAARDDVLARMSARDRHYHGIDHLALLWGCHLRHGAGLSVCSPPWHRLIACAVAFHDAVYDPVRRDNETESAALWRAASPALEAGEIDWVGGTILATADHLNAAPDPGMAPDAWQARLWMLDLDLTPLGAAKADFIANTGKLRAEYAHLDEAAWVTGRRGFLRGLSRRAVLFRTPVLAAAYEATARANQARELAVET
jgi:predicted metal-dependent HD superfamily phosphohydrolase